MCFTIYVALFPRLSLFLYCYPNQSVAGASQSPSSIAFHEPISIIVASPTEQVSSLLQVRFARIKRRGFPNVQQIATPSCVVSRSIGKNLSKYYIHAGRREPPREDSLDQNTSPILIISPLLYRKECGGSNSPISPVFASSQGLWGICLPRILYRARASRNSCKPFFRLTTCAQGAIYLLSAAHQSHSVSYLLTIATAIKLRISTNSLSCLSTQQKKSYRASIRESMKHFVNRKMVLCALLFASFAIK